MPVPDSSKFSAFRAPGHRNPYNKGHKHAIFLLSFNDSLGVVEAALVADWITAWKPLSGEAALAAALFTACFLCFLVVCSRVLCDMHTLGKRSLSVN